MSFCLSLALRCFQRKIRTRLDLLGIPQSGGKNVKTFVSSSPFFVAFIEAAALCSIVLRYACCAPAATCIGVCVLFFLLGRVACFVFRVFCTIAVSPSHGESTLYVFLPNCVFLACDHGLDFDITLCENSMKSMNTRVSAPHYTKCSCNKSMSEESSQHE